MPKPKYPNAWWGEDALERQQRAGSGRAAGTESQECGPSLQTPDSCGELIQVLIKRDVQPELLCVPLQPFPVLPSPFSSCRYLWGFLRSQFGEALPKPRANQGLGGAAAPRLAMRMWLGMHRSVSKNQL